MRRETQAMFHAMPAHDVLKFLGTRQEGLALPAVVTQRQTHGINALPQQPRERVLQIFTRQFYGPLMLVLGAAFFVSLIFTDYLDVVLIGAIMLLHAALGFVQEYRADRALERLAAYLPLRAKVRRVGKTTFVAASEVVVGDILLLSAGDRVVADARIIRATELSTLEAALTGESMPISKSVEVVLADVSPSERACMLFAGTVVASGTAEAVVTAVGSNTEFGKIAELSQAVSQEDTPLERQMKAFSRNLVAILLLACVVVFAFGVGKGYPVADMLALAVALAVAAVPEGLLVTLTVILSLGMQRMLSRQALVRRLVAAETLGGVTVICADKTGTMTLGVMEVSELSTAQGVVQPEHESAQSLLIGLALGIFAESEGVGAETKISGSPTESSILRFLLPLKNSLSLAEYRHIDDVPFTSDRKFSARRYAIGKEEYVSIIGAADVLLNHADCSDAERGMFVATIERMATRGLRVIMVAEKRGTFVSSLNDEIVRDLKVVGFVGLDDPLRPHVRETVQEAARAGIRTVMLTGDHPSTASAVARAIGLPSGDGAIMTGVELAHIPDALLRARIGEISVFARIMPEDKLRIVRALQALGQTVAMTGDGVNDAPALRAADVGVAVGSGTDVAKESADIVLLNNNIATIVEAVREGRGLFDNIRKVVAYFLTSSFTEILVMLGALILNLPSPLLPLHILWINLLADGLPSLALAAERPERDVMRFPPRPRFEGVVRRDMATVMALASVLSGIALLFMAWRLHEAGVSTELIRTFTFVSLGLTSTVVVFSMRSFRRTIFALSPWGNLWLVAAVATSMAMLFLPFVIPGLAPLIGLAPLPFSAVPLLMLLSVVQIVAVEAAKVLFIPTRRSSASHLV